MTTFYTVGVGDRLNKNSDTIYLYLPAKGTPVDSYSYTTNPGTDVSFGRFPDGQTWNICTPTKNTSNAGCSAMTPTSTPTPSPTPTASPTTASYPSGIILSEFMPNPADGSEWVEIKNTSSSEAALTDWKIDDIADGGGSPRSFSATVSDGDYYKVEISGWLLNNSGDEVRLLYSDGSLADKTSYSYSNKGISWIKTDVTWCEAENPTPGGANSSCRSQPDSTSPSPTPSPSPSPSPTPKETELAATLSGEVLAEENSPQGIYLLGSPTPSPEVLGEKTSKSRTLAKIFLITGLVFLFGAALSLWYTQLRVIKPENQNEQKVKIID